jgi:hypothetical protein
MTMDWISAESALAISKEVQPTIIQVISLTQKLERSIALSQANMARQEKLMKASQQQRSTLEKTLLALETQFQAQSSRSLSLCTYALITGLLGLISSMISTLMNIGI